MQVSDTGVVFTFTPTAGTGNVTNLTGATVNMIAVNQYSGNRTVYPMTVQTGGATATYQTGAADFKEPGTYNIQFVATFDSTHIYHSTVQTITVGANA